MPVAAYIEYTLEKLLGLSWPGSGVARMLKVLRDVAMPQKTRVEVAQKVGTQPSSCGVHRLQCLH
jgi:hypothetical protein